MQSYTYQADELYSQACKVKIPDDICPYSSCYESLLEQEQIRDSAREMEANAREIRNQFQAIADSGFPIPTSTLMRKPYFYVNESSCCFDYAKHALSSFSTQNPKQGIYCPNILGD